MTFRKSWWSQVPLFVKILMLVAAGGWIASLTGKDAPKPKVQDIAPAPSAPVVQLTDALSQNAQPDAFIKPVGSTVRNVMAAYLAVHQKHGRDVYWLRGEESPTDLAAIMENWERLFRQLLTKYRDVTPLAQQCYDHFKNFSLTEFYEGASRRMAASKKRMAEMMADARGNVLEVCVIPEVQWQKYGHSLLPSSLFYRKEWRAVMLSALTRPVAIQAALFYHELGHALRDQVDHAPSATAPPMSDEWISEEVEMHELEFAIMDKSVGGKFTELLQRILTRAGQPRSAGEVADAVAMEDLEAYDRMFSLEDAGFEVINVTTLQFLFSLLLKTAEKFVTKPEMLPAAKIAMYRALTQLL